MAWINFTDFTGNSATFASDYLVGFIGVKEQKYPVVALKNGLSAGLFTAQNLLVTENTTIRGNLSVLGSASVFETIVSVTSALSVINTGTGPAFTVQQTGAQPIALFLDDNNSTFRIDDEFKVSFFNCHATGSHSIAEGNNTVASGGNSHAQGNDTISSGTNSHAQGNSTVASGYASHTEGYRNVAIGYASHAEGYANAATGNQSHAEGVVTVTGSKRNFLTYTAATRTFTFAPTVSGYLDYVVAGDTLCVERPDLYEGISTIVVQTRSTQTGNIIATTDELGEDDTFGWFYDNSGSNAHAEGDGTTASGAPSHAEGVGTMASGNDGSHAEGWDTVASGDSSHAEGHDTVASGLASHAEGFETTASGINSHAEGNGAIASGDVSHAEGDGTVASGAASHAQGSNSIASGQYSHAQGDSNMATGEASHAEGYDNVTGRKNNFLTYTAATCAFTFANTVSANFAYVTPGMTLRGYEYTTLNNYFNITVASRSAITGTIIATTNAIGPNSTSGYLIDNSGAWAHAEGYSNVASGEDSHAEGYNNVASGNESHAEGFNNVASGQYSHAQGQANVASGESSHAQGQGTIASGLRSTATGQFTSATKTNAYASGKLAYANHNRSWVWQGTVLDDAAAQFVSTRTDQFAIRAANGFYLSGAMGINTDSIINALTVNGNISGTSGLTVDALTGKNISLVHTPANDGTNAFIQLGEFTTGSTTASAFSGFRLEYNENTNAFNLSSIFGAATTDVININNSGNVTANSVTVRGTLTASGNVTGNQADFTNTTIRGLLSAGGDVLCNSLTAANSILSNTLTSRNISLAHTPANDGVNPFIQLGEFTTGSTTASVFSGFRLEYNEATNSLSLSGLFGSTINNTLTIDVSGNVTVQNSISAGGSISAGNFTGYTPYTVTFTPFTSGSVGTGVGGTMFYPAALSGTIPSNELSTRFINNRGSIDGILLFANDGAVNLKQYTLEFAKNAAFTVQKTNIYLRANGEITRSIMRPVNGSFANGRIVLPNENATQPWGTNGTLVEYPYAPGDSIYYRIGFAYPIAFENMGLSAGYIRIIP